MERERLCSNGAAVTPKRNDLLPPPMKQSLASLLLVGTALLPDLLATPSHAATMILHNFTGSVSDGAYPSDSLTLSGSKLYGMTFQGGSISSGVLFSMNTDGTGFGLLHSFTGGASNGANPQGSLTLSGSKLFGITRYGGTIDDGALFTMNTDGSGFGVLHSFTGGTSDGRYPRGSLTLLGSKLYGMTKDGGSSDRGTLFSMNTDGTGFSLLHSFAGGTSDGAYPFGSLTFSGSKLFGLTAGGGSGGNGTLFSVNTDGTGFDMLHRFTDAPSDGARPYGSLTLSGSKLYGMTEAGGGNYDGTIFSINTDGTGYGLLHSFDAFIGGSDGGRPNGSLTLSGSKLYGMTANGGSSDLGTLFTMNTDGSGFSLLHSFAGGLSDGDSPYGSLTLSGSTLYGMTYQGGRNNAGTLFSINTDGVGFSLMESFGGTPADGAFPVGNLTLSGNGLTLYGMTQQGGTANQGVIFSRAIPEPGTFALLGLGTLLLSARRRNAP